MTKLFVNTNALEYNLKQIQNYVGSKVSVMPIIKASAYGIGFEPVSKAIINCKFIGVANVEEACELAKYCPNSHILILYQPSILDIPTIINNNFHIAISELEFLHKLEKIAKNKINIHLSLDTGLDTIGILRDELINYIQFLKRAKNINLAGVFSQFASFHNVEQSDIEQSQLQIIEFQNSINKIENELGTVQYKHLCNGSALLTLKNAHFNMVRAGTLFYGYYDEQRLANYIDVKPSLSLVTEIISIRTVKAGPVIGYGKKSARKKERTIATLAIGYSDGLSCKMSKHAYFIVNGQKANVVGNICMNLCTIDISNIKGKVKLCDEVTIFDTNNITLEQIAKWCKISREEFLCGISQNVKRIVI